MAPLLESTDFTFGEWSGGERRADGVITMPYYSLSPQGYDLVRAMPVRMGFDWPTWKSTPEAIGLARDHEAIASATAEQVVMMSTLIVRQDRFVDGLLARAFESGLLLALAKRARVLAGLDQAETNDS
jgi:hypothetical protein